MQIKYFIRNINDMEMEDCKVCNGTGMIKGTIISDALDNPIENTDLSCPNCNGSGKVTTGKILHYTVSTILVYGEANVEDNGKEVDYILGFVCDDPEAIENYKKSNGISSFTDFPGALQFYGKTETLYDTYEEAKAVCDERQKNWKPEFVLEEKQE